MRFLFISLLCLASPLMELPSVFGDLRAASQPRNNFQTRQRNANVPFQSKSVIYMEPSDFQYAGLRQQRDGGAYDNFLRSNIDNEQDKRNFNNEAGRDMLPFRSFEGAATDASNTVQTKIPDGAPGPVITAAPGEKVLYPLRWNNPHASELEVNIWIMNVPNAPVVVPIRRPTCSGEGHQDNVISFTVPTNFNDLGASIPGFTGCKKEGDCVLQVYAHSVEPRTYAIGVPIVVTGTVTPATATGTDAIQPAKQDVGLDLSKLTHDICLSSTDPSADITVAVPRAARLVSDVFNHAYQNSDYSPYSGQQPEAISQNLQASAIISMIPANQGELGKALLQQQKPQVAAFAANLRNKVQALVQKYEGIVNKIIAQVGDKTMTNTATVGTNGVQKLATCFRCAEVGAITPTRLTTSTYVPSFAVPQAQLAAVKALVPGQYSGLISAAGNVQIYQAVLNDLAGEFTKAAGMGLLYQPAVIKATTTTMADATQFKKRNAAGQTDNGIYAASKAAAVKLASAKAVSQEMAKATGDTPVSKLAALAASDSFILPESLAASTEYMVDMDGVNTDASCDNDASPTEQCQGAKPLFAQAADGSGLAIEQEGADSGSSSSTVSIPVIAAIVGGVGLVAIILAAVIVKQRHAKKHTVTRANTHKETHISHFQPQPTHNNFTHNIEMDNTTRV